MFPIHEDINGNQINNKLIILSTKMTLNYIKL